MKLSDEWRGFWKWANTHLAVAIAAAPFVYENFDAISGALPQKAVKWVQLVLAALMVANSVRKKA